MKKRYNNIVLALSVIFVMISSAAQAQYMKTAYFMDKTQFRLSMNPAMAPMRGYFNIPAVGAIGITGGSNSLTVNRLLFSRDGKLVPFLDPRVTSEQFLNGLKNDNRINADVDMSILGFGWHTKKGFWNINVGLNSRVGVNLPKDLLAFMKNGCDVNGSRYDIGRMSMSTENYMSVSLGYSRRINDKLNVGINLKYLVGLARAEASFDHFNIETSSDMWRIQSKGSLTAHAKGLLFETTTDEKSGRKRISSFDFDFKNIGVAGMGGAIDLGATYQLFDNVLLSAAVTDLGMISWSQKACQSGSIDDSFEYVGFDMNVSKDPSKPSMDDQMNDLSDRFGELLQFSPNEVKKSQTKMLTTRFNIGGEYSVVNNKIGFGLVYHGAKSLSGYSNELTLTTTFRPKKWFSAALSYSFLHSRFDTFGFALNFSPSWINLFIGTDYMITKVSKDFIPISQKSTNVFFGLSIPMTKRKDLN